MTFRQIKHYSGARLPGTETGASRRISSTSEKSARQDVVPGRSTTSVKQTQLLNHSPRTTKPQPDHNNEAYLDSLPKFHHHLLKPDCIRLIIVHPGTSTQDLECCLVDRPLSPLDTKGRPILNIDSKSKQEPYEALSYSWDRQTPSNPIRIRKEGGGYDNFLITDNLRDALQSLRHISNDRRFWVDAICIDQTSHDDKNQQLPLMARIYTEAENVCISLGREDEQYCELRG